VRADPETNNKSGFPFARERRPHRFSHHSYETPSGLTYKTTVG
jgi:hypothetical protein